LSRVKKTFHGHSFRHKLKDRKFLHMLGLQWVGYISGGEKRMHKVPKPGSGME
jgi:hypothetical protein